MINHEDLIAEWKKDCQIDSTKVEQELFRLPLLHSKYLEHLQGIKVKYRTYNIKYNKMKLLKTRYYNGELSKEELAEYGWSQYKFTKPLKSQMDSILEADEDLQNISEKLEYIKILVDTIESIMREIHSRGYTLKSVIDIRKFEAGV